MNSSQSSFTPIKINLDSSSYSEPKFIKSISEQKKSIDKISIE